MKGCRTSRDCPIIRMENEILRAAPLCGPVRSKGRVRFHIRYCAGTGMRPCVPKLASWHSSSDRDHGSVRLQLGHDRRPRGRSVRREGHRNGSIEGSCPSRALGLAPSTARLAAAIRASAGVEDDGPETASPDPSRADCRAPTLCDWRHRRIDRSALPGDVPEIDAPPPSAGSAGSVGSTVRSGRAPARAATGRRGDGRVQGDATFRYTGRSWCRAVPGRGGRSTPGPEDRAWGPGSPAAARFRVDGLSRSARSSRANRTPRTASRGHMADGRAAHRRRRTIPPPEITRHAARPSHPAGEGK